MACGYAEKGDYDLILEVLSGHQFAFEVLLNRYKNLVYSVILRMMSDKEEANDQAQEVFIKVYKNLAKYNVEFKFSTWIMKITTNHIIDYRRKNRIETADIETAILPPTPSAEDDFLAKEQSETLSDMVENLPEMYKIPIVLYHQQGLSYQEISEIVNEPMSKVKNRIFRGRKILREKLQGNGHGGENYGL